ncbi:permease [Clostridium baratii]|uniref:permease n=1 Tax=Clostridium baratii TaxID=1561 RepID=UPI001C221582|nr:permease [Clostridium baratii]
MNIISLIWDFFQNQVLGMQWLNGLIGTILSILGVDINERLGGSIQFFIYDTLKIMILLSVLIFLVSYIQSYFPPERTKKIVGKFKGVTANIVGALLGTLTPFCSCSSIPLFIGFTNAGLPVGVTFSFLISSPLVDIAAFLLLTSIFGVKIALAYVIVGIILAVVGGTLIDKLGLEKYVEQYIRTDSMVDIESPELTRNDRVMFAKEQTVYTIKKVWIYVIVGVGIGALIHNWIPTEIIQLVLGQNNFFSVLLATVVGVPMYADIFGTLPIAEALFFKGVGLGTVLSFMMSVTALSLPSIIMLRKAVKPKLLVSFVGIVTVGILIIGYTFNFFGYLFV